MIHAIRAGALALAPALGAAFATALAVGVSVPAVAGVPEPSPYAVLPSRAADAAPLDAPPPCRGFRDGVWGDVPDAVQEARRAEDRAARRGVREALDALAEAGDPVCAGLERARLDLLDNRLPEARVEVARILRDERTRAHTEAARFYRAEALHRDGRVAEASPLYQALAGSAASERVRDASALRLAEAEATDAEGFTHFESLLEDGEFLGADLARWGPPAAELAVAAGDLEAARRWLEYAWDENAPTRQAALVSLRRGDVLHALGNREEARSVMRGIAARHAGTPVGALANVRLLHLGLAPLADEELRRRLERTARSGHHSLGSYVRGVLAGRLVAEEPEAALELLVKLASDARATEFAPNLRDDLDAVLAALTAPDQPCTEVLRHMGGRRSLLLRQATRPEPFLRVGDCLLEAGLAGPALDFYRALPRRFGTSVSSVVLLRSAQAAFATGALPAARAPAEAQVSRARRGTRVTELGAWTLLLARLDDREGHPDRVVEGLAAALAEDEVEPGDLPAAVHLLARSMLALDGEDEDPELRVLLRDRIAARPFDESAAATRLRAEARLQVAHLHRRAGEFAGARALYADAAVELEPGALRARALYWEGALAADLDGARIPWRSGAAEGEGGPWATLVREELAATALREAIARDRRAPAFPGARP